MITTIWLVPNVTKHNHDTASAQEKMPMPPTMNSKSIQQHAMQSTQNHQYARAKMKKYKRPKITTTYTPCTFR